MGGIEFSLPSTAASMYSYKSDFILIIMGWHSGSPILALNSSTFGSPSSTITPA
jgi:hypothetical protein